MTPSHRVLLEAAAWLHDIGKFINFSAHHKHSHYIIMSSPLVGLSTAQRGLVAAIARYHRKAEPGVQHELFRNLNFEERGVVVKLSALLRLAEALDAEHGGMVAQILVRLNKHKVQLTLVGESEMLLERWAVATKLAPFEKALGVKMVID